MSAEHLPLMSPNNIVLYEAEYLRLKSILAMTQRDLRAELILLIDRSGQQIAFEGPARGIDLTALASLAAANIAATDGLARLVGEPDFSILFHQGKRRSIHISDVSKKFSLVVVFDDSISLGMVRLRVKRATAYLDEVFRGFQRKTETTGFGGKAASGSTTPVYFTDEDIDKLFSYFKPKG
jgi:predicted regulator of Ras-like GTPase activity (Roadblock/LC7/MglB family)